MGHWPSWVKPFDKLDPLIRSPRMTVMMMMTTNPSESVITNRPSQFVSWSTRSKWGKHYAFWRRLANATQRNIITVGVGSTAPRPHLLLAVCVCDVMGVLTVTFMPDCYERTLLWSAHTLYLLRHCLQLYITSHYSIWMFGSAYCYNAALVNNSLFIKVISIVWYFYVWWTLIIH